VWVLDGAPPAPVLDALPDFTSAKSVQVSGTVAAGSMVAVSGGLYPVSQRLYPDATQFSMKVWLRGDEAHPLHEGQNLLSVATVSEYGVTGSPTIHGVVRGDAFPTDPAARITALTVSPASASVALYDNLNFTCEATFSDSTTADVTGWVNWEDTANGEAVTGAGLYLNSAPGTARLRASYAGVFSNIVPVTDSGSKGGEKAFNPTLKGKILKRDTATPLSTVVNLPAVLLYDFATANYTTTPSEPPYTLSADALGSYNQQVSAGTFSVIAKAGTGECVNNGTFTGSAYKWSPTPLNPGWTYAGNAVK
jgi:hypothetical protein